MRIRGSGIKLFFYLKIIVFADAIYPTDQFNYWFFYPFML